AWPPSGKTMLLFSFRARSTTPRRNALADSGVAIVLWQIVEVQQLRRRVRNRRRKILYLPPHFDRSQSRCVGICFAGLLGETRFEARVILQKKCDSLALLHNRAFPACTALLRLELPLQQVLN